MLLNSLNSLSEVWEEAINDKLAVRISTPREECILYKGIKISNSSDGIKIYNTKKGSLRYPEIDPEDYYSFLKLGFRKGVYVLLKRTYEDQINIVNSLIQNEVNQRNNKKHYDSLKLKRDTIINKYTQIIKKEKL